MVDIDEATLAKIGTLATETAEDAGKLAIDKWLLPRNARSKGYRDWVTDADYEVQAFITDRIRQQFPDHGFLTEEEDLSLNQEGSVVWIIDPIDGTTNYSRHIPTFCVSVAAVQLNNPGIDSSADSLLKSASHKVLSGVIYDPFRREIFCSSRGHGSTVNGRRMMVSMTQDIKTAIVGLDWSHDDQRRQQMFAAVGRMIHQIQTVRAIGSAALALAWVAAGRLDAYCNLALSAWDVVAGQLLISEAGGKLTNIHGDAWQLLHSGCLASNGHLHQNFVKLTHF